jgi:hypothetical protein
VGNVFGSWNCVVYGGGNLGSLGSYLKGDGHARRFS